MTCCPVCETYPKAIAQAISRAGQEHHDEMASIRQTESEGRAVTFPSGSVIYSTIIRQDRLTTESLREAP